jgi:hypothetical protein
LNESQNNVLINGSESLMAKIELGNVCDSCAIDWLKIYINNSKIESQDINYNLVTPKECEECDGEAEE